MFLHLWSYANLRDAFLIPVMNIESKSFTSPTNIYVKILFVCQILFSPQSYYYHSMRIIITLLTSVSHYCFLQVIQLKVISTI